MRLLSWLPFLAVLSVSFAATPPTNPVPAKPAPKKAGQSKTASGKTALSRKSKGPARPSTASRQAQPSPERYKQIQEALAAKGYLKAEPNGVWDAQSSEALRQFQSENKLSPTGKLSSASLIGLGLGPGNAAQSPPPDQAPPAAPRP